MHRLGGRQGGRTLQMSRTGSSNHSSGLSKDPPLHYSPGISWFKGRFNDTYFLTSGLSDANNFLESESSLKDFPCGSNSLIKMALGLLIRFSSVFHSK